MSFEVMCAFCGDGVPAQGVDPCALVVISKWQGPDDEQGEQQFFTHAACLLERMHPEVAAEMVIFAP